MYRKFSADHIFTGHKILPAGNVLITDVAGTVIDLVAKEAAGDGVEIFKGLLTPGFINAHCHLELSHLKGVIPQHQGLVAFVQAVMSSRASYAEQKLQAMLDADTAMYNAGIVAVGDICNTTDSIPVKEESQIRWHNFIEVSGFVDAAAAQRLQLMKAVFDQFQQAGSSLHRTTFSPHAPYSVSKTLFRLINDETAGGLITIHNQECEAENDLYVQKNGALLSLYKNFGIDISFFEPTGKSSFQSWLPMFTRHQSIISVHNTFIKASDIAFFESLPEGLVRAVFFCICNNANQYIEQFNPPFGLLIKNNCNIVIGTDSLASNWQLNILEEIKTIQRQTNYSIPLTQLLQWATLNAAKALQMDENLGSFDKGKQPGIVLIEELNSLQTTYQSFARRVL